MLAARGQCAAFMKSIDDYAAEHKALAQPAPSTSTPSKFPLSVHDVDPLALALSTAEEGPTRRAGLPIYPNNANVIEPLSALLAETSTVCSFAPNAVS